MISVIISLGLPHQPDPVTKIWEYGSDISHLNSTEVEICAFDTAGCLFALSYFSACSNSLHFDYVSIKSIKYLSIHLSSIQFNCPSICLKKHVYPSIYLSIYLPKCNLSPTQSIPICPIYILNLSPHLPIYVCPFVPGRCLGTSMCTFLHGTACSQRWSGTNIYDLRSLHGSPQATGNARERELLVIHGGGYPRLTVCPQMAVPANHPIIPLVRRETHTISRYLWVVHLVWSRLPTIITSTQPSTTPNHDKNHQFITIHYPPLSLGSHHHHGPLIMVDTVARQMADDDYQCEPLG